MAWLRSQLALSWLGYDHVRMSTRPCGCNTTTLLNLNRAHHFGFGAVSEGRRRND